eukprot:CAMPEP_0168521530 /NCGR_PEP_ID=MMETSP0405-20121227/8723_1 /TAXON_ID=498012 /ORGANISM="Trichosphaerium sp, Strain Am-I-7 wt" /LENGTH=60 /DNA_ID=CAMNT_0008542791 /DNA_START=174 /DNA_END=353 /DNA_ORIENTATION=+
MTLVLDLDETLIHATVCAVPDWDHRITVTLPTVDQKYENCTFYVKERPFLDEFIDKACKW